MENASVLTDEVEIVLEGSGRVTPSDAALLREQIVHFNNQGEPVTLEFEGDVSPFPPEISDPLRLERGLTTISIYKDCRARVYPYKLLSVAGDIVGRGILRVRVPVDMDERCRPVPPAQHARGGDVVVFRSAHGLVRIDFDTSAGNPFEEPTPWFVSPGNPFPASVREEAKAGQYPYHVAPLDCDVDVALLSEQMFEEETSTETESRLLLTRAVLPRMIIE